MGKIRDREVDGGDVGGVVFFQYIWWPFHLYLQVDYEMALEYATHGGVSEEPKEAIYIQSLETEPKFIDLRSPIFVFRLFQ